MKNYAFAAAACAALGLAGCQSTGGSTPDVTAATQQALAYSCPIAIGINLSTLTLSAAEKSIVATAVADCEAWQNGTASIADPAVIASLAVQALEIAQESGIIKSADKAKARRAIAMMKGR
jgi:hypothetical protein